MIDKIFKTEDIMKLEKDLPEKVIEKIKSVIKILDYNYGTDREVTDDGGYICLIRTFVEVKYLKENILRDLVEEFSDEIYTSDKEIYNYTLYLLSSDYSVVVITKNLITNELLK